MILEFGIAVFLTVVLDLYDRKVIDGDLEATHTTIPATEMAFANRKVQEGLIFHSDRGVRYCTKSFRETPRERSPTVRKSMRWKGNCWDNACAESFFTTLKRELETLDGSYSAEEVRQSVFTYLETYYNRIHRILVRCIRHSTMWHLMCLTQRKLLNGVDLMG
jgi:transposase InsO family protein